MKIIAVIQPKTGMLRFWEKQKLKWNKYGFIHKLQREFDFVNILICDFYPQNYEKIICGTSWQSLDYNTILLNKTGAKSLT